MRSILVPAFLLFLLPTAVALAEPIEWPESEGGNGHFYEAEIAAWDWATNRVYAESLIWAGKHGYLATITSEEEHLFILDRLGGFSGYWLGGYQTGSGPEPDGGWAWVTGETWSYTNWSDGEPNDDGAEGYLMTVWWNTSNQWNDEGYTPYEVHGIIIEYGSTSVPLETSTWGRVKSIYSR